MLSFPKKPLFGSTAKFPHAKQRILLNPRRLAFYGFSAKFPHAKRRILLIPHREFFHFRPRNAPRDWFGAWVRFNFAQQNPNDVDLSELVKQPFWRVFSLPDPQNEARRWRIFWRDDFGYVTPVRHSNNLRDAFFWPRKPQRAFNLFKTPTSELKRHFENEWLDPQSDVRAALEYADLTKDERQWRAIKWLCGGEEEVRTILESAFVAASDWSLPRNQEIHLAFSVAESSLSGELGSRLHYPNDALWDERFVRPFTARGMMNLVRRLKERNVGVFDSPNGTRYDWPVPWIEPSPDSSPDRSIFITRIIRPPTQHERLEAALFLREWLEQHAPDLLPDWFPNAA